MLQWQLWLQLLLLVLLPLSSVTRNDKKKFPVSLARSVGASVSRWDLTLPYIKSTNSHIATTRVKKCDAISSLLTRLIYHSHCGDTYSHNTRFLISHCSELRQSLLPFLFTHCDSQAALAGGFLCQDVWKEPEEVSTIHHLPLVPMPLFPHLPLCCCTPTAITKDDAVGVRAWESNKAASTWS